ncbi:MULTISPECIES: hypothetical protein [Paenibacillus]|uniref:Uncharacterized protein n=1 Tax=Paenibacillus silvae TaxID=1325358 RepID=A0A2W6NEZ8_9BACL|nr:hypothetical protein [Paenibacillus silvae]PZT54341.1 hypothetical protein DN757_17585 [Paenibacillus silvae]
MTTEYIRPTWTIEEVIVDCNVSKKAIALIDNFKAILVTEELRYEFMMRVPFDPNGHQVFDLLHEMRKEQLCLNPMSDESFLDMYLLNPIQALRQYFKHSIVPAHEERIQQWNIDLKELVKLKQTDYSIHLNRALTALYK